MVMKGHHKNMMEMNQKMVMSHPVINMMMNHIPMEHMRTKMVKSGHIVFT